MRKKQKIYLRLHEARNAQSVIVECVPIFDEVVREREHFNVTAFHTAKQAGTIHHHRMDERRCQRNALLWFWTVAVVIFYEASQVKFVGLLIDSIMTNDFTIQRRCEYFTGIEKYRGSYDGIV